MAKLVKANDDGKPILGEECDELEERLLLGWMEERLGFRVLLAGRVLRASL